MMVDGSTFFFSRLAAKRAAQATQDLQETKKNEAIRRKKTQETEQLKEDLRKREQLKEVEKRKREKLEDAQAKERVRQQIKEQQEARKRQAEQEKALREGRAVPSEQPSQPSAAAAAAAARKPPVTASHSETRLQLRLPSGPPLVKTFAVETTLFEVASAVESDRGACPCLNEKKKKVCLAHALSRFCTEFIYHDLPPQGLPARSGLRSEFEGGWNGAFVFVDCWLDTVIKKN